jgi:hypothetical protein
MMDKKIPGITDCACSRTVLGIGIFNAMVEYYNKKGMKYKIVEEEEHYRFGAGKEFVSHRAIIGLAALKGIPFVIRVSVIDGQVPLLISRKALAMLGMVYDLAGHVAHFKQLVLTNYLLGKSTL